MDKQWTFIGTECLIRTGPMGTLNGYIGIEPEHPWWGQGYMDLDVDVVVHGGLTYTSAQRPGTWEEDGLWWMGFDTAHAGDVVPEIEELLAETGGIRDATGGDVLRGEPYVEQQVELLAAQAQAAGV